MMSSTTRGGAKLGYSQTGKNYPVLAGSDEKLYVNVPWTDTNTTYSAATQSAQGLMSAADKVKLDGIATGAQVNAVTSVAGKTGAVTLAASDVGARASTWVPTWSDVTSKPTTFTPATHTHTTSEITNFPAVPARLYIYRVEMDCNSSSGHYYFRGVCFSSESGLTTTTMGTYNGKIRLFVGYLRFSTMAYGSVILSFSGNWTQIDSQMESDAGYVNSTSLIFTTWAFTKVSLLISW